MRLKAIARKYLSKWRLTVMSKTSARRKEDHARVAEGLSKVQFDERDKTRDTFKLTVKGKRVK